MATLKAAEKDKPQSKMPPPPQPLPKVINGGIAGVMGVSVVFPIDMVKTRLQNQVVGPNGEKQYKNIIDCFKKTYATEGYFGMYRGAAVNILLVTPEKAIKLSFNDIFRYHLTLSDGNLPVYRQMLAGGSAGACSIVVTTPMELLKIQMQDAGRLAAQAKKEGKKFQAKSTKQVISLLLAERGVFGLYRGLAPTGAREITFSVTYFPAFAFLNDLGPKNPDTNTTPFWCSFLAGLCSGSVAALGATPLDVIKTRMQTITKGTGEKQYTGIMDCITTTLKNEGVTAFFKGGACRMMVIAPLYAIAQTIYYIGIAEYLMGMKM